MPLENKILFALICALAFSGFMASVQSHFGDPEPQDVRITNPGDIKCSPRVDKE